MAFWSDDSPVDQHTILASRYALRQELGAGGMSRVFLADDVVAGRAVAVKVMRPELVGSLGARRFSREIDLLASLDHPNILPILDWREADDVVFYVMPYASGETLRQRLAGGVLSVPDMIRLARDIASALDYAHARGVVHRDVKPENIVFEGPRAMLLDFGIARIAAMQAESLSSSGIAIGTATYMSPEQAVAGSTVDGRSDLYALGCVLYESLTGDPPFFGATPLAVIARHVNQPPPSLRTVRPDISAGVEAAVHAAMAKSVAQRPACGADLLAMLDGAR